LISPVSGLSLRYPNSRSTDNMRCALDAALERLPAYRLLVTCSPDNEADLAAFLDIRRGAGAQRPSVLAIAGGRDDQYIWASHDDFDLSFSRSLHDALAKLVPEPRGFTQWETAGA
jgi:hypothetical protein